MIGPDLSCTLRCRDVVGRLDRQRIDGGAYGWAFVKPVRKLYYNITITSVSVIVAFARRD